MGYSTTFWNLFAKRYASMPLANPAAYERKLALTQAQLKSTDAVLEFGCGTGSTAIAHAPHVRSILAIDVSPRMIEICREKAAAAGVGNIDFRCASMEELDTGNTFDVVMAHSILHLVSDRHAVLAKAAALLKPGGLLVSSTVCLGAVAAVIRMLLRVAGALRVIPAIQCFTREELVADMRAAGLVVETEWQPSEQEAVFMIARKSGS